MELLEAAAKGDILRVEQQVCTGANVAFTDNQGPTPLIRAAENGDLDVACFLVEYGAAVNASDSDGLSSLI